MALEEQDIERIAARVAGLQKRSATPEPKVIAMPCKVTAILPTYDDMWCLPMVLRRLKVGHQSFPLRLFTGCTEPDTDNVMAWLAEAARNPEKWPAKAFEEFRYFGGFPNHGSHERNLSQMYHTMLGQVETQYVWFQDADVLAPPGIIPAAIEVMEQDPTLGFVGTNYVPGKSDHVRMGNSLMLAGVAREINWRPETTCICRWLCNEELPRRGLRSVYIRDKLDAEIRIARHLPLEE
jgi:hypothetical protein